MESKPQEATALSTFAPGERGLAREGLNPRRDLAPAMQRLFLCLNAAQGWAASDDLQSGRDYGLDIHLLASLWGAN